ncbi:alpha/beta hydrolase family protein [Kordiimonas aestuarii]|uniref:alpha/beta hydrolase family protein n=1 Tax=Kordiimonas aestuarii TaxID=1005925 RepID=UPI0021CE0B03|nr:prolyl oligopeptidase family serine peptidase [Kordiimonas aestuarii]
MISIFARLMCLVMLLSAMPDGRAFATGDAALLEQLVRVPKYAAVALSTDGHFLSALHRKGDDAELVVWNVDAGADTADALPYLYKDLSWISWVGNGRLLISLKEHGLVLYDAHIRRLRPLIEGAGPRPDELPPILLSALPDDPTKILLQWEDPGVPGYPAVYRVDAVTGESEKIVGGWAPVIRWWASPEGKVKLGEGFNGRDQLLFSSTADGAWRKISDEDFFKGAVRSVLAVETGGATALVLAAHDSDTRALWRYDIKSGRFMRKLASHKKFDIASAILDPVTAMAVGASYVADDVQEVIWQDAYRARLADVSSQTGAEGLTLATASYDGRRLLYRQYLKSAPPRYHLYDAESETLITLPHDAEDDSLPKPETRGVWIPLPKRGDGAMHALLSVPPGGVTGRAVVLVHGGPVKRVTDSYNPLVSWLTANGYSVLQPNFRGSSGFGERWRRAGYNEWGRDMQEDVRTALDWMVDKGVAEAGRMCAMGGSYGGYASLLSAIKDDDLIACAISLNGVTSLPLLVDFLETLRFHDLSVPRIRGRLSDYSLRRRSPLNRADLVRVPVLLLHATKDNNVPFLHSQLMHRSLTQLEKEHNFIVLEGAEHQLVRTADKRIYYQSALNFLDAHIGRNR